MSTIKDSLHDKVFQNFDKVKPDDLESEHSAEDSGRLHKVVKTKSGLTAAFSHHFMARMDHLDENTGEKDKVTQDNPIRRVYRGTKTPVLHSGVKVHIRKILHHVSTSSGDHIPTKSDKVTAVMYKHKPTGQQILVHLHHDGEGKPPKTIFQSYGGDEKTIGFGKFDSLRADNNKSEKKRIERKITLESLLRDRIICIMEAISLKIHHIELD